ncbi:MAG: hypothetical protein ACREGB_04520, partial [Candidatus Saccharimonadales bacterium]
ATILMKHPEPGSALVYDLRFDPTPFLAMSVEELAKAWRYTRDPEAVRLPVKALKYNRCPAIAPLGVIKDDTTWQRLGLTMEAVAKHRKILQAGLPGFAEKMRQVLALFDAERVKSQATLVDNQLTVDSRLYDGFVGDGDKQTMRALHAAQPEELSTFATEFKDERLKNLVPLYVARNYPAQLSDQDRVVWEKFCRTKVFGDGQAGPLADYFKRLGELAEIVSSDEKRYLLEELQLYGQSLVPSDID